MPEGEVRITAADLPRLDGDEQYVAWVVNSETNQFQRVGASTRLQDTAAVHYENVLPDAIPEQHWNLLLVTVEDSADADQPERQAQHRGRLPARRQRAAAGLLPNTGGDATPSGVTLASESATRADWLSTAGLAALTLTLGGAAGYGYGKRAHSSLTLSLSADRQ